jgi:hypothetical protein
MEMSASFSVGAVAYRHDIREGELPKNVDPSLTKYNITFVDKLQGRSVEQYTNERMQGAVDEYNAKQKRADRKVKNYVDWHRKNGPRNRETSERTPLMYECQTARCGRRKMRIVFGDFAAEPRNDFGGRRMLAA